MFKIAAMFFLAVSSCHAQPSGQLTHQTDVGSPVVVVVDPVVVDGNNDRIKGTKCYKGQCCGDDGPDEDCSKALSVLACYTCVQRNCGSSPNVVLHAQNKCDGSAAAYASGAVNLRDADNSLKLEWISNTGMAVLGGRYAINQEVIDGMEFMYAVSDDTVRRWVIAFFGDLYNSYMISFGSHADRMAFPCMMHALDQDASPGLQIAALNGMRRASVLMREDVAVDVFLKIVDMVNNPSLDSEVRSTAKEVLMLELGR